MPTEDEDGDEDAVDEGRLANYKLEDAKRATLYEDTTLKRAVSKVNSAMADQSRQSGSVILNYNEFKLINGPIVVPKTLNGEQSTLSIGGQRDDDDARSDGRYDSKLRTQEAHIQIFACGALSRGTKT